MAGEKFVRPGVEDRCFEKAVHPRAAAEQAFDFGGEFDVLATQLVNGGSALFRR